MVDASHVLTVPYRAGPESEPHAQVPSRWRLGGSLLRVPLGLVALVPVGTYLWIALHQIGYRFELEWMEGGAVEVVRRVALGQGIYVKPSLHFVPWPYTPLYWWLSAGVSHLTGVGFLPLRLVSLVSSLATLVVLALLVRSETGEWAAGLVAAGIYAATFRLAGDWFAIGRVDSLMLALLLLSVAAARRTRSWAGGVGVGVLAFLAFFTKQSALIAILPVLAFMLVTRWRTALAAIGTLAGLIGVSTVAMDAATGGWYRYYVFDELVHQGIASNEWTQFWSHDLRPLWLAGLIAAVGVLVWAFARTTQGQPVTPAPWSRRREGGATRPGWERAGFYGSAAAGLIGASWVSRLHNGGYTNVEMPAFAGVALLAGLGLGTLLHRGRLSHELQPQPLRRRMHDPLARTALGLGAAVGVVAQLYFLRYPVAAQIPTKAGAAAGTRLLAEIKSLPGQVVVLDHPWYGTLVGKGTFADVEALHDVLRAGPSRARSDLEANLAVALSNPRIGAVILDSTGNEQGIGAVLRADFTQVPMTWDPGSAFFPVAADSGSRPTLLFVRKGTARGPAPPASGSGAGGTQPGRDGS